MKRLLAVVVMATVLISCTDNDKSIATEKDNTISFRTDTMNVVKLTDTLVIYESTCRGCAYENSTLFHISDSTGIIKLQDIVTIDNSSPDMSGGSVSKHIILVPQKTGTTIMKLFKWFRQDDKDSTKFRSYFIEVKN